MRGLSVIMNLVAVVFLGVASPLKAAEWPAHPVKIIVPFAAGGNTDGIARLISQHLSEVFGQTFVVENHGGAGGVIAAELVARAPADGYTLLIAAPAQMAIVPAMRKVPYDPVKDFAPISNIASNPYALVVNSTLPVKSLTEFIEYVRARPSQLTYASAGGGTQTHLAMALFLKKTGLEMTHVSYKGNATALTDVVAGHVPAMFTNLSDALSQAKGGRIRLLAVSSSNRVSQISNVPTLAESGFPDFKILTWNGLLAPAGTPPTVISKIAAECAAAVKDPKILEHFKAYGVDPLGSTPEEFANTIAAEILRWRETVKAAELADQQGQH